MAIELLRNKKLLILVGGPNLVTLVERAKELGIYTIVTDYYSTDRSPTKLVADEYWDISWEDLDTLEKKCRDEHVDGITTGYSESPVGCCIELCRRLGLPCYCTEEQLLLTKDKVLFKNECRRNGVPVVKEYSSPDSVTSYPVIVKPVDRAGSIGISVANDYNELQKAYNYAMEKSYCKKVIIEDYISTGKKFDVTYAICGGQAVLLSNCDTIYAQNNAGKKVVQSGWLFPSRYNEAFLRKADKPIKRMIQSLEIKDGYIFFSGFAVENDEDMDFVFFETGFRLSGGHMYQYMIQRGIVNILDLFIVHALTGSTALVEWRAEEKPGLKCAIVNYFATDGTVSGFDGIEEIRSMRDCNFLLQFGRLGEICSSDKAILSKMTMIHFCNSSAEELAKDIAFANSVYSVKNEYNEDIVYDRINPAIVSSWWD